MKYNQSDIRNILERSSARETASRVAVGAFCQDILRKFGVIIVALLALWLTRAGIGYITILVAIGIIAPIVCGSKKDAVFTGILYATLNYVLSYPSGLYLINYMPSNYIPITVSSSEVMVNLFIGLNRTCLF